MKQFFLSTNFKRRTSFVNQQVTYVSQVSTTDRDHPRALHSHEELVEIILITEGTSEMFIGNQYFSINKGSLIIYNSNVVHDELYSSEPVSLYCIGIKGIKETNLRPNALISDDVEPIFETGDYYSLLLPLFQTAFEMLEQEVKNYDELVQSLGGVILDFIKENILAGEVKNVKGSDKLRVVQEIKRYLDRHFSEEFKLKDFNRNGQWPINEYYFAHKFKELYDYSPIEYLQRRRIGEAQTLLINTDLGITDIAYQVGFNSSSYFTTLFKKIVKMTPKDYRDEYTEREKARF